MKDSFETGGAYLRKMRRLMGCLSAPTLLGSFLFIDASTDAGTLAFSIGITAICSMALYKAVTTRKDGTLRIDDRGIWVVQSADPLALNAKTKSERTHVAWSDIEHIDIGYEQHQAKHFAPNHISIEPEKRVRRSRFMAHMSGCDWSIMIDHKHNKPCHLYAANMNEPWKAGPALGLALWSRGFIASGEE